MSLALILGGEKTRLVFFNAHWPPWGAGWHMAGGGGGPLRGLGVEVLGARKGSPLECALKGGIWEEKKGYWDSPVLGRGVRPGLWCPQSPCK